MFIELHESDGHATLLCVDDIQRVRKGEDGSEIYMNEQDEIICVRESVPMIRDLIIRAGGLVAAAQKIEGTASPIRLHPADQSLPKE